jgi:signal transduction histidine kinase
MANKTSGPESTSAPEAPVSQSASGPRIAVLLQQHQELLVEQWITLVLSDPEVPEANRLSEDALRDHIPRLLARMRDLLIAQTAKLSPSSARSSEIKGSVASPAQAHALHRFANGYTLGHALREMTHFRATVVDLCGKEGARLEGQEAKLLQAMIDAALTTVAVEMEQAARADLEIERERLRQEVEFRERFMGILGHDLRNPLSAIVNAATLLQESESVPAADGWILQRITTSADRMTRMISDLLDVTRARSGGRLPVRPGSADLHAICLQVMEELKMVHQDRVIVLRVRGDTRGEWDADRIAQLVQNLVSNALDYSTAETSIRIAVHGRPAGALLRVHNRGPAIPPDLARSIFEPFQRGADETRTSDGLGLGLFIAHQIATSHGGSLQVRSGPVLGTTFTATLPRNAPPPTE